jgi:hypothetical protein
LEKGISDSSIESQSSSTNIKRNKQQEQLVRQLESRLEMIIQQRNELAEELLKTTQELDTSKTTLDANLTRQEDFSKFESRYNLTLELLGEKEETTKELREDILDLKAALRQTMIDSSK